VIDKKISTLKNLQTLDYYAKLRLFTVHYYLFTTQNSSFMKNKLIFFFNILIAFYANFTYAQQQTVQIFDNRTNEPIVQATIQLESLDKTEHTQLYTDEIGKATFSLNKKSTITTFCVGYQPYNDTINVGENLVIKLNSHFFDVDEVVVTAQYSPEQSSRSIYKVQVINSEEIALKGAANLQQLLAAELNIQISQDNVLGSSLNLQGVSGENVKILIDGIPVIGRMNGSIDLSQINLNNVERIEVVEGPMSVSYGTNALGGVINIITKDNAHNGFSFSSNSYYESAGVYNFDGGMGYVHNNNNFLLTGGRNFFDGFSLNDTSRQVLWKPKEQYFLGFKYRRKIGNLVTKYSFSYFNEMVQDKGKPYREVDENGEYYIFKAKDGYYNTIRNSQNISVSGLLTNNIYVDAAFSNANYSRIKKMYTIDLNTFDENLTNEASDHDTTTFNSWVARGTFSRYSRDTVNFNYQCGYDINLEKGTGKKIENHEKSINDYAVFAGIKLSIFQRLELQPAIRYAYNSEYKAPLTPSINAKIDVFKNFQIRGSYALGFRAPSLKELYLDFVDLNHDIHGNPNLEAESSDNLNISMAYSIKTTNWSLNFEPDFFYNIIENKIDLIVSEEVNGADTSLIYIYDNFDEYRTMGGKFAATFNSERLWLKLGFSEIGRYNIYNEFVTDAPSYEFSPEFSANLKYWIPKIDLQTLVTFKYTGKYVDYRLNADGLPYKYEESAFKTLDISLSKSLFKNKLTIVCGGKNLFDVTNITTAKLSGGTHSGTGEGRAVNWGRTFFVNLKINLN